MESIIQTFHIDWKVLIAQIINFFIVISVLWFFAFKPLAETMRQRTEKIEKGLKDAEAASKNIMLSRQEKEEILRKANAEAQKILQEAKKLSEEERSVILAQTREEVQNVVVEGKKLIAAEKEKMAQELRQETSELVVLAVQKILQKTIDKEMHRDVIVQSFKKLDNNE